MLPPWKQARVASGPARSRSRSPFSRSPARRAGEPHELAQKSSEQAGPRHFKTVILGEKEMEIPLKSLRRFHFLIFLFVCFLRIYTNFTELFAWKETASKRGEG